MPIIRKQLKPWDVYPEDIRYNEATDTVQSRINGEWKDSPERDPRKQTIYPPRITSNTKCDAAESVKDAFKGQIDQILTAIDNAGPAFTIAGIILSLFTFGPFGVFISIALVIANAMLDAGTTAISAALTEPVYHTFACILYCRMNSSGRLNAGTLLQVESDITSQIGGLGAIILNSMVGLAGEGGINNLASLGMSSGDCSDCGCADCGTEWTTENLGGGDNRGNILGVFDGYLRVESTNGGGTTQQVFLNSLGADTCCKLIDFRFVEGGESIAAVYKIFCGNAQTVGNLIPDWGLESCVNFLAAQTPTGSDIPFVVEFLFIACD